MRSLLDAANWEGMQMTRPKPERVRRLPRGVGRDFVVGDIHGAFDLVFEALNAVGFNPARDRLLCAGDLGDRGRYSRACLPFLREPWVHAVRGNHEQMLLDLYAEGELDQAGLAWHVERNGMGWWLEVPAAERQAILAAFAALPLALEVDTVRGSVGVIHAEVPLGMDWQTFTVRLEAGDPDVVQSCLWGRRRDKLADTNGVLGIDRLFVGHTPQFGGARRLGNIYYIDSGAVFAQTGVEPDGRLSFMNAVAATTCVLAPRELRLLHLAENIEERPFSPYARAR